MILAFGGAGQLGQELLRTARACGIPLVAVSREEADIAALDQVGATLRRHHPTLVVNAAAFTGVDLAESEPETARRANARGAEVLAAACAELTIPLIHISTDYVFDGTKIGAYRESDPIAPLGVYGRTKAEGEQAVRQTNPRHVILRTSWVYGVFGNNFLKTMLRLAQERDELRVVADQHGSPTSTRDIARVILAIAPRLIDGEEVWGTYHFAGSGVTTWHGFAQAIVDAAAPARGRRPKVTAVSTADYPTPARRPKNSTLDCSRFTRTFGLTARPWQEEVRACVKMLLEAEPP